MLKVTDRKRTKIPTEGKLLYRAFLWKIWLKATKTKTAWDMKIIFLLLFGKLPTQKELNSFTRSLSERMEFPTPSQKMSSEKPVGQCDEQAAAPCWPCIPTTKTPRTHRFENVLQSINLVAKMPLMIAMRIGHKSIILNRFPGFASPQTRMRDCRKLSAPIPRRQSVFSGRSQIAGYPPDRARRPRGRNNSAFATHVVSSSGTDTYSAMATAVASLKGPKHGGANLMVAQMIEDLKATVPNWTDRGAVMDYLRGILRKKFQ